MKLSVIKATELYNELIHKHKLLYGNKKPKGIYTERHHIIPVSMGGKDGGYNRVYLPFVLHKEAHRLLAIMYPDDVRLQNAWKSLKNTTAEQRELAHYYCVDTGKQNTNKGTKRLLELLQDEDYYEQWYLKMQEGMSGYKEMADVRKSIRHCNNLIQKLFRKIERDEQIALEQETKKLEREIYKKQVLVNKRNRQTTNKYHFVHDEHGCEHLSIIEMVEKYSLDGSHMTKVAKGSRNKHQGWRLSK